MLTCRVCGDEGDVVSYRATKLMALCAVCDSQTPDKVFRSEFDKFYWGDELNSVALATRKNFYEDYLMSNLTLVEYRRQTSGEGDVEMSVDEINPFDTIRANEQDDKYETAEALMKDLSNASGLSRKEIEAWLGEYYVFDEVIDDVEFITEAFADTIRDAKLWRALPDRIKKEWGG